MKLLITRPVVFTGSGGTRSFPASRCPVRMSAKRFQRIECANL